MAMEDGKIKSGGRAGRVVRGLFPWAVSGAIIAYIAFTEDMGALFHAISRARLDVYLEVVAPFLAVLLFLESVYLYFGFRWFAGAGRFWDLFRARAALYLLTIMSIFVGLGGIVLYGRRRYGISYSVNTAIVLNELLHELASQCLLAMMVGLVLPAALIPDSALYQVRGVMLVGMGGVGFYLLCVLVSRVSRWLPESFPRVAALDPFVDLALWQYGACFAIKLAQNLVYGFFLHGLLLAFGIHPPLIASLAFMQVIHLTRAIPVSAFGIGVDQIAFEVLFGPWAPEGGAGAVLAASLVFTFTMIAGRALLGLPFVGGVWRDLVESPGSVEGAGEPS